MAMPEKFPLSVDKVLHWVRLGLPPLEELVRLEEVVSATWFYNAIHFWGHHLADRYPEAGVDKGTYLEDIVRPLGTYIYDFYATETSDPYPAIEAEFRRLTRNAKYKHSLFGQDVIQAFMDGRATTFLV